MFAVVYAREIMGLLYDLAIYEPSLVCFRILMISLLFMTVTIPLYSGLLSAHRESVLLKIALVLVSLNIIGNLYLIPRYGINGASVATVLTEMVSLALHYYCLSKVIPFVLLRNLVLASVAVLITGTVLTYMNLTLCLGVPAGMVLLGMLILAGKGYTIDEIRGYKAKILDFQRNESLW